jgi:hypothetical protein
MSNPSETSERQLLLAVLERLYAPLVRKLDLTPEDRRSFYELILEAKLKAQALMADLLRHEDLGRLARASAEIQQKLDARLQVLLGPADFGIYQEYQAGVPDRGLVERMKSDFAECPLTEAQQELLIAAMATVRKSAGASTGGAPAQFSIADSRKLMTEKLSLQESMDQQVLQLAAGFLSPAQLKILASAQARMMTQRREGYRQARAMCGVESSTPQPPIPNDPSD